LSAAAPAPVSPAGFWKRVVAYSLDVLVLSLLFQIVFSVGLAAFGLNEIGWLLDLLDRSRAVEAAGDVDGALALWQELAPWLWRATWLSTLAYAVLGALYFAGMEASPWQATLGKRLLGIHVVDLEGRRIGPLRALSRFLAAGLSWFVLNLGHALAAWTPDKRALHDYIAGTRVDNVDPANTAMPLWGWLVIGAQLAFFLAITALCAAAFAYAIVQMGAL